MNKYFITIRDNTVSNALDQRLQKELIDSFRHVIIPESQVPLIKNEFERICNDYQKKGGRAKMIFSAWSDKSGDYQYSIGTKQKTSMYITLTLIRGTILNN